MHVSMRLSDAEYSPYYILDTAVSSSEEGGPVLINYGRTTREKRELIHHTMVLGVSKRSGSGILPQPPRRDSLLWTSVFLGTCHSTK